VIGTDHTGSCKSNYHTITATTAPGLSEYKRTIKSMKNKYMNAEQ
jgi:hypothetical protein